MSTRSYIVRENNDGSFDGIYCHQDGYLTYNGAMLIDHYKTKDRVDKLIELGHMSVLGIKIEPDPSKEHDFENRQDDVCVFYGRDRHEKDQEASKITLEDIDDPSSWIEYCYVFTKNNTWKYFECGHLKEGLKDLDIGLENEYKQLGFPRPKGYYGFYTDSDIEKRIYDYKQKQGIEM